MSRVGNNGNLNSFNINKGLLNPDFLQKDKFNNFVSMLAVSISYTFLAIIIIFITFSQTALTFLQKQVELTLFIKDNYSEESIFELKQALEIDSRVMEVEYISKERALEIFNLISKDDPVLNDAVTTNIFPASLKVKTYNLNDLDSLASEYEGQEYIDSIRYSKEIKDNFSYYAWIVSIMLLILFSMFLVVSFGIIISTIRINIYQKKEEIEIMKLVGATDDYIRKPFVMQGLYFSMVGSFVASIVSLILTLGVYFTNTFGFRDLNKIYLGSLVTVNYLVFSFLVVVLIISVGYFLGFFGTKTAVSKYLNI
jgi:cell division transport system permease protein